MGWESFRSPGGKQHNINGGTLTAAATLPTPKGWVNHITGTTQTTLIPLPYEGFEGTIVFIPDGAWTGATGGVATATNRALAAVFVAVANIPVYATYSKVTGLWYVHSAEAET